MSIEEIIIKLSYLGIFLWMTSNGTIGFPSSQIIYIISGYFAFTGNLNLAAIILVGGFAQAIGNFVLYEISRRKGISFSLKIMKYLFPMVKEPELMIKKTQIAFKKRGTVFLFFGKLINPIKIIIPVPAGMAKMNRTLFFIIVLISSTIWATAFTLMGFYFGKSFDNFSYYGAVMFGLFIVAMLYFQKYINSDGVLKELQEQEKDKQKH